MSAAPKIDNDLTQLDTSGPNGGLVQALQSTVDKRVSQYIAVRDRIKAVRERHEAELKPLLEVQELLGGWLDRFMETSGASGIKTSEGTCYRSVRHTASLADPAAFMDFVIKNRMFELLDRRANATAVKDYVAMNGGQLPPGVNLSAIRTVGVRRPGKKED